MACFGCDQMLERSKERKAREIRERWFACCEVIRLTPPAQGAFREAIEDFDFNGFSIPKGWKLYWSASSTLRNPEYFPQSQRNLIREDLKEMNQLRILMCHLVNVLEKIEYARMEILVFMHNLVKRFKCQTVIPNGNITYNPTPIPAKGLPVRLIPQRS
ncbi:Cytochrome P450 716B2 [Glycine soja]|nr:Cytochrome P450 716B2 [Glycine soja]